MSSYKVGDILKRRPDGYRDYDRFQVESVTPTDVFLKKMAYKGMYPELFHPLLRFEHRIAAIKFEHIDKLEYYLDWT